MISTIFSPTPATETPFAEPADVVAHFERMLHFETDCWDTYESLKVEDPGFVLLDVRAPSLYAAGHLERAVNLPHRKINERNLAAFPADAAFVVYCSGPHCNGADKAAIRLARLGRRVKKMVGGVEGWKDEGLKLIS